ncbi:endonuclease/exonuclease/phosphatase family protein [Streptomyces sp. MUM 203J]|uniref:endonuclease/exonuclease/phosphatase family protein n=1 Tax=Streptomyces sp. MUM 203J TaxID=2791990 RepID=UPI001F046FD8|nr:endonuclease/exonuclease/phosphatase family protein [Streptomyces sp. MUM 203J]MCH0541041.1 endonuclease/exonuclease/phosphatase family protein [Streptomyces sp. MUM 203J]
MNGSTSSRPCGSSPWTRGRVAAGGAALTAWLIVFHGTVPDLPGHPGSLLETFLPWLGLAVPALLIAALVRRSATALLATLLPAAAWLGHFGHLLVPFSSGPPPTRAGLTVVQHNAADDNPDPAGTARALLAADAGLVALQEVVPATRPAFEEAFRERYPYHTVQGTVGLWSAYPLDGVRPLDIRPHGVDPGWQRGLRATATTPHGEVAVYVVHLPSLRITARSGFDSARRDESAALLGSVLAGERLERVVLLGDLNGTVDDRGLAPLTTRLDAAASGLAFSWPASAPLARIDQVLARGAEVARVWTLPRTGSDHLPVAAALSF